jgi:hypothetical protein
MKTKDDYPKAKYLKNFFHSTGLCSLGLSGNAFCYGRGEIFNLSK